MKITPQCVITLTWTLKDTLGEILDELDEPVEFLLGGNDLLATIEESLQGHEAGALAANLPQGYLTRVNLDADEAHEQPSGRQAEGRVQVDGGIRRLVRPVPPTIALARSRRRDGIRVRGDGGRPGP